MSSRIKDLSDFALKILVGSFIGSLTNISRFILHFMAEDMKILFNMLNTFSKILGVYFIYLYKPV